jgi:hypothetical protein
LRTDVVDLQIKSMQHGIPITMADPAVLDFDKFGESESTPGQVIPTKGSPPNGVGSGFATLKTAVYPKESEEFKRSLDTDAQFATGDFPSIYGGSGKGSQTLGEYTASQGRALNRLSLIWKLYSNFWGKLTEKAIRTFINDMKEDERFARKTGPSSFINVWIRKSDLEGKVGSVEPDPNSSLPLSWNQKQEQIFKLLQLNSPEIMGVFSHPENAGVVSRYLGFPELYIPNNDARNKQLNENTLLLEGQPIQQPLIDELTGQPAIDQLTGQPMVDESIPPTSTIPVDPELDNHQIEFETGLAWINSEQGQDAKQNNPEGFNNLRLHILEHKMFVMMAQQAAEEAEKEDKDEEGKSGSSSDSNSGLDNLTE